MTSITLELHVKIDIPLVQHAQMVQHAAHQHNILMMIMPARIAIHPVHHAQTMQLAAHQPNISKLIMSARIAILLVRPVKIPQIAASQTPILTRETNASFVIRHVQLVMMLVNARM